jgi:hypothetical protein
MLKIIKEEESLIYDLNSFFFFLFIENLLDFFMLTFYI